VPFTGVNVKLPCGYDIDWTSLNSPCVTTTFRLPLEIIWMAPYLDGSLLVQEVVKACASTDAREE